MTFDPLLAPLLAAADAEAREGAIEGLVVQHAQPVVRAILGRFRKGIGPEDLEDVSSTVALRLVRRLQSVGAGGEHGIQRLRDFVASLTYNAVYDVMRRRFPERTRLKNRVRYALTRDPRLALRTVDDAGIAGLHGWPERSDCASPFEAHASAAVLADADREDLPRALVQLFTKLKKPLLLEDLIDALAEVWNIRDAPPPELVETEDPFGMTPFLRCETHQTLAHLWQEVRALIPRQRAALLLNLRAPDSLNAVALLVLVGVATIDEIADAIGIASTRLAEIWNDLPLDDRTIAGMLGLERQQVIDLRRSARARLTRRTKSNESSADARKRRGQR
jgi:hypothetical protein